MRCGRVNDNLELIIKCGDIMAWHHLVSSCLRDGLAWLWLMAGLLKRHDFRHAHLACIKRHGGIGIMAACALAPTTLNENEVTASCRHQANLIIVGEGSGRASAKLRARGSNGARMRVFCPPSAVEK